MAANTLANTILWIKHAELLYVVVLKKKDTPGYMGQGQARNDSYSIYVVV